MFNARDWGQKFQSTLPRRERRLFFQNVSSPFPISIHAPAKGATGLFLISAPFLQDFNPRSREGSDRVAISSFVYLLYFNPRSREGSDYVGGFMITLYSDFNPRSREGSDYLFCTFTIFFSISIHAPAKGATIFSCSWRFHIRNFNPRSREGSDLYHWKLHRPGYHFNPRSLEGSDDVQTVLH